MAASNQSIVPRERAITAMQHCRKINFIADGSIHSINDCLVTVAWANEISAGVFAPIQVMKTGPVSPQDLFDDNLLLQISEQETGKGCCTQTASSDQPTNLDLAQRANASGLFQHRPLSWAEACESRCKQGDSCGWTRRQ